MPKIQRRNIPQVLLEHLVDRVAERNIDAAALAQLLAWLNTQPEVPDEAWYKRFPSMTVCGRGSLVRTFLTPSQTPVGTEV
jgi:hypothetical protein